MPIYNIFKLGIIWSHGHIPYLLFLKHYCYFIEGDWNQQFGQGYGGNSGGGPMRGGQYGGSQRGGGGGGGTPYQS